MVLAASSLSAVFQDLAPGFVAGHPGATVEFTFAGSQQLRAQLEQGAPGSVFASADRRQMEAAVEAGVVEGGTVRVFATNRLVVLVPASNPAKIGRFADLSRPGVRIAVADPAVPAGRYTREMLDRAKEDGWVLGPGFVTGFESNIVTREQSVAGVVAKVALGEVDAGVAYESDLAAARPGSVVEVRLPNGLPPRAEYVAGVTVRAEDASLARGFVEYLTTPEAAEKLRARGFGVPEGGAP
jgi:molybdate transport system substrate-binding protein